MPIRARRAERRGVIGAPVARAAAAVARAATAVGTAAVVAHDVGRRHERRDDLRDVRDVRRVDRRDRRLYLHSDGRPLLGRKIAGKSQRELRHLGLLPDAEHETS